MFLDEEWGGRRKGEEKKCHILCFETFLTNRMDKKEEEDEFPLFSNPKLYNF